MRSTFVLAGFMAVCSLNTFAQSGDPIVQSYENGCSSLKAGSAEQKKCLVDGYKEISKNCAELQMMLINNPSGTSSVKEKTEMWCDAKKKFKVKS